MSRIEELLQELRREWSQPREAVHRGEPSPFPLACSFEPPVLNEVEIESLPVRVSRDLRDFWRVAQRAELFKDQQYGQWGIEVLSPEVIWLWRGSLATPTCWSYGARKETPITVRSVWHCRLIRERIGRTPRARSNSSLSVSSKLRVTNTGSHEVRKWFGCAHEKT